MASYSIHETAEINLVVNISDNPLDIGTVNLEYHDDDGMDVHVFDVSFNLDNVVDLDHVLEVNKIDRDEFHDYICDKMEERFGRGLRGHIGDNTPLTIEYNTPKWLAKEVLQNLPEYAMSFICHKWDYENCIFELSVRDWEDKEERDTIHTLTLEKAEEGMKKLLDMIKNKKCFFYGINMPGDNGDIFDPGNWDAEIVDALLQISIFGKIIYG